MTLFADDDVGLIADLAHLVFPGEVLLRAFLGFKAFEIIAFAIHKQHHVGVLLDRARFAQVRELGLLVLAVLHLTRQLGERNDRHRQLLGERLEGLGDFGDFLHPVLARAFRAGDELEVVDHHQIEADRALEAATARHQRADGQTAGIVDIERDAGDLVHAVANVLELGGVDLALTDQIPRNARIVGHQTGGELVGRHLEREECDNAAIGGLARAVGLFLGLIIARHREGDVGGQRGFAHGGTTGEDDEVGRVQAAHLASSDFRPEEMPDRPPPRL